MFCSIVASMVMIVISAHCSFIWIEMTIKILLEFGKWEQNTKEMDKKGYWVMNEFNLKENFFCSAWKINSEVYRIIVFFFPLLQCGEMELNVCWTILIHTRVLKFLTEWFCDCSVVLSRLYQAVGITHFGWEKQSSSQSQRPFEAARPMFWGLFITRRMLIFSYHLSLFHGVRLECNKKIKGCSGNWLHFLNIIQYCWVL